MALVSIRRSPSVRTPNNTEEVEKPTENIDENDGNHKSSPTKCFKECYFTNKGAALVLGVNDHPVLPGTSRRCSPARCHPQPDIQHHLQSMFFLLRAEETLKMAVKLESAHAGRTRYLVVVCHREEAALLGIDCNHRTTVGLVVRVLADTAINLDGDGGFSVCVCEQQHIFKPVSVQAMWSALQTLHRASARARECNHFAGGTSHAWAEYYESRVDSDRSCLNEWHAMDCLESRRPPSPDSLRNKPRERDETEQVIRCTLKEIMMSVDLDEVTSKVIRVRLEEILDMNLAEYKSFIDHEMLTILGQMDAPTEIFDHVYLGSEWNASNLEELRRNGVGHILNVTREIDNFFPGMFKYLNVRVYDDEKTDLLKHWDNTYKYINKARREGSKVLVHCKMGISRSASVVIAYAMKAYNWNFDKALKHVKGKRNCIKPNANFLSQLETYQGILDAMKNKEKLQRSKSETNLKSPKLASKIESKIMDPTPLIQALTGSTARRRRSWSPDTNLDSQLRLPTSVSLENLGYETLYMLMPYANGTYSVSPNQIIRLKEETATSVKHIVNELENAAACDRKDTNRRSVRLNLGTLIDMAAVKVPETAEVPTRLHISPSKNNSKKYQVSSSDNNKIHTWDPGEGRLSRSEAGQNDTTNKVKCDSGVDLKLRLTEVRSSVASRRVDVKERRMCEDDSVLPSRLTSPEGAVVGLCRHSSWGSYDTRATRPQVIIREEITSYKRFSEKIEGVSLIKEVPVGIEQQKVGADLSIISECVESRSGRRPRAENERKFNETCAILKESASRARASRPRGAATWCGRLSASAPTESWLRGGLRRRRPASASHGDLPRAPLASPPPTVGRVSNLKKEFEARSGDPRATSDARSRSARRNDEDLSVKVLVDKYDSHTCKARCESVCEVDKDSKVPGKCKPPGPSLHLRNSFSGVLRSGGPLERPPIAPNVVSMAPAAYQNMVVSTVMSKAQNKKQLQHGKTHPLTRLNINRSNNRCSNPVYNTM